VFRPDAASVINYDFRNLFSRPVSALNFLTSAYNHAVEDRQLIPLNALKCPPGRFTSFSQQALTCGDQDQHNPLPPRSRNKGVANAEGRQV